MTTASSNDEKTWGMLAHLSALAGFIIPFGNIIGPLVIWLIKKNEMPFVDDQGKESLNFQITASIILFVASIVTFILTFVLIGLLLIPVLILAALAVLVFTIIGAVKANGGEAYRYPFSIKLIK